MGTIPTLIQWNLSSLDTNGAEESGVLISEVEQEWYILVLGVGKVSCL